ncbi:MAG: hypothetical protein AAFX78_04990 [Cyanobacteria bacterium J06638_20]
MRLVDVNAQVLTDCGFVLLTGFSIKSYGYLELQGFVPNRDGSTNSDGQPVPSLHFAEIDPSFADKAIATLLERIDATQKPSATVEVHYKGDGLTAATITISLDPCDPISDRYRWLVPTAKAALDELEVLGIELTWEQMQKLATINADTAKRELA